MKFSFTLFFTFIIQRLEVIAIDSKFDKEYPTQWLEEVKWLSNHGIRWAFVKNVNGIDTYKYTKTLELFKSLAEFYGTIYYK